MRHQALSPVLLRPPGSVGSETLLGDIDAEFGCAIQKKVSQRRASPRHVSAAEAYARFVAAAALGEFGKRMPKPFSVRIAGILCLLVFDGNGQRGY